MARTDVLLDVLKRFACTLSEEFDVTDVLYELADHAVEVIGASAAGVSLADERSGRLQFVASNSDGARQLELVQQETGLGPCHEAFRTASVVAVADLSTHHEWPAYRETALDVGLVAVVGIPMTVGDRHVGALNVYCNAVHEWSHDEIETAGVLANMATSYVLHASRLAAATRVNEQLQHALESRVVIEQAKGLLAGEQRISLVESFDLLRHHARANRVPLHEVADAVVKLGLRPRRPDAERRLRRLQS